MFLNVSRWDFNTVMGYCLVFRRVFKLAVSYQKLSCRGLPWSLNVKGLVGNTDDHYKTLTHNSVEAIFGKVFTRYLRSTKGEKHFQTAT